MAGERHGMCELAFKRTCVLLYESYRSDVFRPTTLEAIISVTVRPTLKKKLWQHSVHFSIHDV
jgi:hypothetical protein